MDANTETEPIGADAPIACTLTDNDAAEQALEWVDLHRRAIAVTAPVSLVGEVEDLARRETSCCAFLTIDTTVSNDLLTLDISSENPDALPVIAALAGLPLP